MTLTAFPNGVSSFGVPIVGGGSPSLLTTGKIYFVDDSGSDDGEGTDPAAPLATWDAAFGKCTANQGDIIVLMPGHAEAISAAAGVDADVAGVRSVGLGVGVERPTITFDTIISVDIDIDAAGITFENIVFSANFADITAAIDVNANDFTMINCHFQATAVDMNFLICIQDHLTTSDRIKILNCSSKLVDASDTHFINFAGVGDGHEVRGCTLIGDWGTMCIGGAGVITFCVITDNIIYNATTTVDACVNLAATATGIVMRNMGCGGAAQANGFTATACAIAENYYGVLSEDLSAILDPIVT